MAWRTLVLVLALLVPLSALADRVALVVGNGAYANVTPLPNPPNDAQAVAEALEQVGFDVVVLTDADHKGMEAALRAFGRRATDARVAVFYYAGHGLQVNGLNYLLPVSAVISATRDLRYEAIELPWVIEEIEAAAPRLSVVILDACRDNPLSRSLAAQAAQRGRSIQVGSGLAAVSGASGMLIAYATAPGAVALDGDGTNSPFTKALVRHITEPGLEVGLLFRKVRESVMGATDGTQVPWVEEALLGEFYFRDAPADADDPETVFWQSIADSADPADFSAYLDQYPGGRFAALAHNRLRALRTPSPASAPQAPVTGDVKVYTVAELAALEAEWPAERREAIQQALASMGLYDGAIDGQFGARTRAAISRYETFAGRVQTGYLPPERVAALLADAERVQTALAVDPASPGGTASDSVDAGDHFLTAVRHDTGRGVATDPAEARHWYRLAAGAGDARAANNLGAHYALGQDCDRDMTRAELFWRLAAAQGHEGAAFNLGQMYRTGDGVARDPNQALFWYDLAATRGHEGARMAMNDLQQQPQGAPQ